MVLIDLRDKLPVNPDPGRVWDLRKSAEVDTIIVHQAACKNATTMGLAKYHTSPTEDRDHNGMIDAWERNHLSDKGAPGICYHYTIEYDGTIYKCNSHWDSVWHSGSTKINNRSLGICVLGDFEGPTYVGKEKPRKEQLTALEELISFLLAHDWDIKKSNIKGHCEVKATKQACPGNIIMDTIKKLYRT